MQAPSESDKLHAIEHVLDMLLIRREFEACELYHQCIASLALAPTMFDIAGTESMSSKHTNPSDPPLNAITGGTLHWNSVLACNTVPSPPIQTTKSTDASSEATSATTRRSVSSTEVCHCNDEFASSVVGRCHTRTPSATIGQQFQALLFDKNCKALALEPTSCTSACNRANGPMNNTLTRRC
jgi:hypothetical protein